MNPNAYNPFEVAQEQFDRVADLLELSQSSTRPAARAHSGIPFQHPGTYG